MKSAKCKITSHNNHQITIDDRRIALASVALERLGSPLKVCIYKVLIESIATKDNQQRPCPLKCSLDIVFEMRCLRSILGVTQRESLSNEY